LTAGGQLAALQNGHQPTTLKQVRQLQKQLVVRLDALEGVDRDREVSNALKRARAALCTGAPDSMLHSVVELVSFLSPPRATSAPAVDRVTMPEDAKERLCVAMQTRLRSTLLCLLGIQGSGGLDLTDTGTQKLLRVPLERLRCLLCNHSLDTIACPQQWKGLAHAVGIFFEDVQSDLTETEEFICNVSAGRCRHPLQRHLPESTEARTSSGGRSMTQWTQEEDSAILKAGRNWQDVAKLLGKTPRQCRDRHLELTDSRYARKLVRGHIKPNQICVKDLIIPALESLGGQGSIKDILSAVRSSAEFQVYRQHGRINEDLVRTGGCRPPSIPAWEHTLGNNIGRYCRKGISDGNVVWILNV